MIAARVQAQHDPVHKRQGLIWSAESKGSAFTQPNFGTTRAGSDSFPSLPVRGLLQVIQNDTYSINPG